MAETILLYGESGTYKSTQVGVWADYQVELFNRRNNRDDGVVRLITGDSGFGPMADQVERGVLQPWNLKAIEHKADFIGIILAASLGYWPEKRNDKGTGDISSLQRNLDGVAGYAWEGLTEVAALIKSYLGRSSKATVERFYQTGEFTESIVGKENGMSLSFKETSATEAGYGKIQDITRSYVKNFGGLAVDRVVFTAHEGKGTDNSSVIKKTILGPAVIGKALNAVVGGWFGCTLHHESYMFDVEREIGEGKAKRKEIISEPGVRAFYRRHIDPEVPNVFWPAKLDCTPQVMARIMKDWPRGYVPIQNNNEGECVSGIHTLLGLLDGEDA